MTKNLTPADIRWENDTPVSEVFGDVYFSKDNGLAESRYVFLENNFLPERWQSFEGREFTILETGFGTGLNFMVTWLLWQQKAPTNLRLHYISIEKFPLHRDSIAKALSFWPEIKDLADEFLNKYPELSVGSHEINLVNDRIKLTLMFGDVAEVMHEVDAQVDCWFLDGFAPSKNPDMWQDNLYQNMARLTNSGGTFATFTAAGFVKRGIESAGFLVAKVRGFGRKRDMLRGHKL